MAEFISGSPPPDPLARQLQTDVLDQAHPLMVEAFYLAAIPYWYTIRLFAAIRPRNDNRNEGLVDRLTLFSFVVPVPGAAEPAFRVRSKEREILNRLWIARDPVAYRAAHERAYHEIETTPEPDPVVQAQIHLYHHFFVDENAAIDQLVGLFRTYSNDRQLTAIDHLLTTAGEARQYLRLLAMQHDESNGPNPPNAAQGADAALDHLLTLLSAVLAQLRGEWRDSATLLEKLPSEEKLPPELAPYVSRATAATLAHDGDYVGAIAQYQHAMELFARLIRRKEASRTNLELERAQTEISLGDTYVEMALTARGHFEHEAARPTLWWQVQNAFFFSISLPLVAYLSFALGPRVWRRRFWPTLRNLDWIIARLFASGARCYRQADPILEKAGTVEEGLYADEKLAFLFLRMGDAAEAHVRFLSLLKNETAQLSHYRVAVIQAGLAQALFWLGQWRAAKAYLDVALPVLRQYDDQDQVIAAETLLADVLVEMGEVDLALALYASVLHHWQIQEDGVRATEIVERLNALSRRRLLTSAQQPQVAALSATLPRREYPVSYRSRVTVFAPRAILVLLALVLFIIPLLAIDVDTGSVVEPRLNFQVAPLLNIAADRNASDVKTTPDPDFVPELNLDVDAVNLARTLEPQIIFAGWLSLGLFAGYLALITLLGYGAIARASLADVQKRVQTTVVQMDDAGIQSGEQAESRLHWVDTRAFTQSDVSFWSYPMVDSSAVALAAPARLAVIRGTTAWYANLRDGLLARLPATVTRRNLSYHWIRSGFGALYLVTLAAFVAFVLLVQVAPAWLSIDWLGTPYSALDLYPYLYLGLFIPPIWWFIIQPLRIRQYIAPYSRVPWWAGGAGLTLLALIAAAGFRTWLTTPDLYPALLALVLVESAAWMILRVRHPGEQQRVYSWPVRALVCLVAILVLLTAGTFIGREVRAYNAIVVGNQWRDQALKIELAASQATTGQTNQQMFNELAVEQEIERLMRLAVDSYNRALTLTSSHVQAQPGPDAPVARDAADPARPLRINGPQFTWYTALHSRAAMWLRLREVDAAIHDYTRLLDDPLIRNNPLYSAELYAGRGLAWLQAENYERAVQDYTAAIDAAHQADAAVVEARYHLWRGVANHNIGRRQQDLVALGKALDDYRAAREQARLDAEEVAQSLMGEGWIRYLNARGSGDIFFRGSSGGVDSWRSADDYSDTTALFQQAQEQINSAHFSAEEGEQTSEKRASAAKVYHALGYTYYTRRLYDEAKIAWEQAAELDPTSPSIQTSLGTLYWRLGTLGQDYSATGSDRCSIKTLEEEEKRKAEAWLSKSIVSFKEAIRVGQLDYHMPKEMGDAEIAFTFRTIGQVYWLLRNCPGHKNSVALEDATQSYAAALMIEPETLLYNQMYARLAYALWTILDNTPARDVWLELSLEPINKAYAGGMRDHYTLSFRTAILGKLLPRRQARFKEQIDQGDIQQTALEFEQIRTQTPEIAYPLLTTIEQSLLEMETRRRASADAELDARYFELKAFFDEAKRRVPEWLLAAGRQQLLDAQAEEGTTLYRQGLALLMTQPRMDLNSLLATELKTELQAASAITESGILTAPSVVAALIHEALPELEQAAQGVGSFQDSTKLGWMALAHKEFAVAGRSYNEAIRYMAMDKACSADEFRAARTDLYDLWEFVPIRAFDLWDAMEVQRQTQLKQHPELETREFGIYWRCRAWFKYHVGLVAFLRHSDVAAYTLLRSSWPDADRAIEFGTGSGLAYLWEGAWGFYHLDRADRAAEAEEYSLAFEDYAKAEKLIQPKTDNVARGEKLTATFRAGLMAAYLGDQEQFQSYYHTGLALADEYKAKINVAPSLETARKDLTGFQETITSDHPMWQVVSEILEELPAPAAQSTAPNDKASAG